LNPVWGPLRELDSSQPRLDGTGLPTTIIWSRFLGGSFYVLWCSAYAACRSTSTTWLYRAVVSRLSCPSITCTYRMLALFFRRSVAKECLSVCGWASMPAVFRRLLNVSCTVPGLMRSPCSVKNRAGWLSSRVSKYSSSSIRVRSSVKHSLDFPPLPVTVKVSPRIWSRFR
jgi:hypothetical protein